MCDSSGSCGKLQQAVEIRLETIRLENHNLQVTYYEYVEKVFTNLRHKLYRSKNDEMFDLKTNVFIWRLFMPTTMKYDKNLIACQSTNFEGIKTLFDITLRLIVHNSVEILNNIDYDA